MDLDKIKVITNLNKLLQIYDYYYIYTKEQLKKYCKKDTTQIQQNIENKKEFAEHILKIISINENFLNNLEMLFKKDIELFDTQIEFINEYKNYKNNKLIDKT